MTRWLDSHGFPLRPSVSSALKIDMNPLVQKSRPEAARLADQVVLVFTLPDSPIGPIPPRSRELLSRKGLHDMIRNSDGRKIGPPDDGS
jgi:hypothetical protein